MDFQPSKHQAAGHDGYLTSGPVFAKLTNQQELDFYVEAQTRGQTDESVGNHLSHWMPTFMGTLQQGNLKNSGGEVDETPVLVNPANESSSITNAVDLIGTQASPDKQFLVLENLYYGFSKPSILDIKLGSVLVDDTVSEEKRQRLAKVSELTTSGSLHFRVCGMKKYVGKFGQCEKSELLSKMDDTIEVEESEEGDFIKYGKFYGRNLTDLTVDDGLFEYFQSNFVNLKFLLTRFHQRLQLFYNCLLDSEIRVKSGSLFFIYESDPEKWQDMTEDEYYDLDPLIGEGYDSEDEGETLKLSSIHFIDFAHSVFVDGQGPDENILAGVENLIDIFAKLIERA